MHRDENINVWRPFMGFTPAALEHQDHLADETERRAGDKIGNGPARAAAAASAAEAFLELGRKRGPEDDLLALEMEAGGAGHTGAAGAPLGDEEVANNVDDFFDDFLLLAGDVGLGAGADVEAAGSGGEASVAAEDLAWLDDPGLFFPAPSPPEEGRAEEGLTPPMGLGPVGVEPRVHGVPHVGAAGPVAAVGVDIVGGGAFARPLQEEWGGRITAPSARATPPAPAIGGVALAAPRVGGCYVCSADLGGSGDNQRGHGHGEESPTEVTRAPAAMTASPIAPVGPVAGDGRSPGKPCRPLSGHDLAPAALKQQQRKEAVARYLAKRKRRKWLSKAKYPSRQHVANVRPREKGRFMALESEYVTVAELQRRHRALREAKEKEAARAGGASSSAGD